MTRIEEYLHKCGVSKEVFEKALSLLIGCVDDGSQELKIEVEEESKPELMTLKKAFEKSGDNDIIKHSLVLGLEFIRKSCEDCQITVFRSIEKQWQIIPAEPKVFDQWECWEKAHNYKKPYKPIPCSVVYFGEILEKNGQRKRDIELKPIIEAARKSIMGGRIEENELEEALLKFKPLKAE